MTQTQILALLAIIIAMTVFGALCYLAGRRVMASRTAEQIRSTSAINRELLQKCARLQIASREAIAAQQHAEERLDSALKVDHGPQLTQDDRLALLFAARTLGHAAREFAKRGSNKINQYEAGQERLREIAARLNVALLTAERPHDDAIRMDWLEEHGTLNFDLETAEIRIPFKTDTVNLKTLRELLDRARLEYPGLITGADLQPQAAVA